MDKKSPYNCCNNKNLKIVQGETSFESVEDNNSVFLFNDIS